MRQFHRKWTISSSSALGLSPPPPLWVNTACFLCSWGKGLASGVTPARVRLRCAPSVLPSGLPCLVLPLFFSCSPQSSLCVSSMPLSMLPLMLPSILPSCTPSCAPLPFSLHVPRPPHVAPSLLCSLSCEGPGAAQLPGPCPPILFLTLLYSFLGAPTPGLPGRPRQPCLPSQIRRTFILAQKHKNLCFHLSALPCFYENDAPSFQV